MPAYNVVYGIPYAPYLVVPFINYVIKYIKIGIGLFLSM